MLPLLLALLVASPLFSAEWSEIKTTIGGKSLHIADGERKVRLVWKEVFVAGDEIINLEQSIVGTYYYSYIFVGTTGGSLQFTVVGPHVNKASRSERIERTILIESERAGIFYLVPEALKNDAFFQIERDNKNPGFYRMSIVRREAK